MLSTIGSRGDVQPLVSLASHLKALGQEVRVCVPPDFREWIESLGIPFTPIGPELRGSAASRPTAHTQPQTPPTPERRRQMAEATAATQFETVTAAALAVLRRSSSRITTTNTTGHSESTPSASAPRTHLARQRLIR